MNKRTIIYSRDKRIQDKLGEMVEDYFVDDFADISYNMEIQKFSDISESVKEHCEIGLGGEILIIFDKNPAPSYGRDKIFSDILKSQYEMTQNLCTHSNIPFLIYEGEIENGKGYGLKTKLDRLKPDIEVRIKNLGAL
ncbi:hypothetical protein CL621_03805 [archaeon]|nr:hypothetical protein [archaeon]|tara:strand:- start:908 stop:1321 length:414 start_codon:yes stop_codon:yes gene_type:complete